MREESEEMTDVNHRDSGSRRADDGHAGAQRGQAGAPRKVASPWRMCGRALLLRCPRCGAPGVRRTYLDFLAVCPRCGLRLDRGEEDYWIGGFMLNFVVAELVVVLAFTAAILLTWPAVPWTAVLYGSLVPAVLGPILLYPFSRNLWLAIDLMFRPEEPGDLIDAGGA